jgi:hypothetical protein
MTDVPELKSTALREALAMTSGARFWRCAIQINPHHYKSTFQGAKKSPVTEQAYVDEVIEAALANGIEVLAITDHNDASSVELFQKAAEPHGIVVFPGFEAESSDSVHVLCLFEPGTPRDLVRGALGRLGVGLKKSGPSTEPANLSFRELVRIVQQEAGGLCIAPHVTNDKGLLHTLVGQSRINAWRDLNLLAIAIPGAIDDLPVAERRIICNQDPSYARDQPRGKQLGIAVLNAADVKAPNDLARPAASCWIKMARPSLEGLKQAFLDPDSRIRLGSNPDSTHPCELMAVAWEGGFLDGLRLHLNEQLNVLVGGRGAGKSSVIESIRWALGQEPLGDRSRERHHAIIRHVCKPGTKVSLLVRTRSPNETLYVVERMAPNPPAVKSVDGALSTYSPGDLLRPEIFGQHELSELAEDDVRQTQLIGRFAKTDSSRDGRKRQLRRTLEKSRQQLYQTRRELEAVEEKLAELPQVEETLKRFKAAGVEDKLKEQSFLVKESRILATAGERIDRYAELLKDLKREASPDLGFASDKVIAELPGNADMIAARAAVETMGAAARDAVQILEKATAAARATLARLQKGLELRQDKAHAQFERVLLELQKSKVDGAQFLELRKRVEELAPLRTMKAGLEDRLGVLRREREQLLDEWESVKGEESRALEKGAQKVSRKLKDLVEVKVIAGADRRPLLELLGERVEGLRTQRTKFDRDGVGVKAVAAAIRGGRDALVTQFGLATAAADRIVSANEGDQLAMEVEELELPTSTLVSLNVEPPGGAPIYRPLPELSSGQRATALLLIALLEAPGPLVVDQPEDDLDNRFITEGVVDRIRAEKGHRQFLLATHNANIPVLGDAELIVGISAGASQARLAEGHLGALDLPSVRALVEEVLEGGKEAFERRRQRYGHGG